MSKVKHNRETTKHNRQSRKTFIFKLKGPCSPMCALYSRKKKTFRVLENRCLQCVESIFVNLPQFVKSGLKESLNRFFWYFFFYIFLDILVWYRAFLFLWVFVSLQYFRWRPHRNVLLEDRVNGGHRKTFVSIRESLFWISGEMGKTLLAADSTDSVFAEFLLHRMLMFKCKQRSRWNQLKAKQASQPHMNNALFNLTYEASDILNVDLSSGV